MLELFFLWVVCGFVGMALLSGHDKGGTGLALGCLLGPIGCIIAAIMRSDAARGEQQAALSKQIQLAQPKTDERAERECPYCAEKILRKAIVCKHCGRDVPPSPELEAPASPPLRQCPHCAERISWAVSVCPSCGQRVPPVETLALASEPKPHQ